MGFSKTCPPQAAGHGNRAEQAANLNDIAFQVRIGYFERPYQGTYGDTDMGLLLHVVMAAVGPADYTAPDRAIHYARQAEGFVRAHASDWKRWDNLDRDLGPGNFWPPKGWANGTYIFDCDYPEFGVLVRIGALSETGRGDLVLAVTWRYRPYDPNAPGPHFFWLYTALMESPLRANERAMVSSPGAPTLVASQ